MLITAGFGNRFLEAEVAAVLPPGSTPTRCRKDDARERNRPTGAAQGRLTPSITTVTAAAGSCWRSR